MKKMLLVATALLLSVFTFSNAFCQSSFTLPRAYAYLSEKYGLDHTSVGDLRIVERYVDAHNQVEHIYLTQTINGFPVFGSNLNLILEKNGSISSVGHRLIQMDKITYTDAKVEVKAPAAIQTVAKNFGMQSRAIPTVIRKLDSGIEVYDKTDVALQDIPVELSYVPVAKGSYVLAWKMQFQSSKNGTLYQSYINASTGAAIANDVLTVSCSFDKGYLARVTETNCVEHTTFDVAPPPVNLGTASYRALIPDAESPSHGTFELQSGIEDPQASPFGWHDTNGAAGAEFTFTRGNNVHAFLDRDYSYTSDRDVDGGVNLIFDFPFVGDNEPAGNQDVSVTNLFVRNNFTHDFAFRYGFNEISGNFQQTNYSTFGSGADFVNALGQFGDDNTTGCGNDVNGGTECINNADFSTPPDGFNGTMRMFTWSQDNSSKQLDILQPQELSGKIITGLAQFGPDISTTPVTGQIVIINDGTADGTKGCLFPEGQDLTGKIAMIDRGLCDFSLKVYNAQEAGAIGAIICNFEEGILQMGAGEHAPDVTIPSVLITSSECNRIRIAVGSGLVGSLVAPLQTGAIKRDGSLDNGIVTHEYGHGISNRLTGGPGNSSCLGANASGDGEESGSMGEGWSDFFALVTSVHQGDTGEKRRGIGTYSIKENVTGPGIRTYPYSTDMTVNPHTYDNIITEAEVHGAGSVWAAMLWDMYWNFVDIYGWDADPIHGTGGNNIAIQLVMDGLKLQPCGPSFTDARDAILKADTINNAGVNSCTIWKSFARRGLGINADAKDPNSWSDGKEGFDLPKSCLDELRFTKSVTPEIKAGDNIDVTIKIINYKDFTLTDVAVEDQIPAGTSYVQGSGNITPTVGSSLVWTIPSIAPDQELTITYRLATPSNKNSIRMTFDDMENGPEERWDISFDPNGTIDNFWYPSDVLTHSGISAWVVGDVDTESKHYLQNFEPYSVSGDYPVYRFYHFYDTETSADGGFLEISTNDGGSWNSLAQYIFRNGYPRKLQYGTFAIPNLYAFSGLSSPELKMTPVYIDLSAYKGEDVKIRYRFGTDDNIGGNGWYVDDVEIMDAVIYNAEACMTSDQLDAYCAQAAERGTIVDSEIINATEDENTAYPFTLLPNPANETIHVIMTAEKSEIAQVMLYDLTGHLLSSDKWNLAQGTNQKSIDINRLASGMYVLEVKTRTGMRSERFVKE